MKLPPLNGLRVFEAAARHLSFTTAAAELHVTQGAVSQQIKALEAALGVPLFVRGNRELRLTAKGSQYALAVREALRLIADATAQVQPDAETTLTVSCLPSFAHKWLMPRLGRFLEAYPQVSLRVHTSFEVVDLARDGVDCAIRHGPGPYPDLFAELLLTEELTPVCSPEIAERLRAPEDLVRETLLRDFGTPWEDWLSAAGIADLDFHMGTEFLDASMALQAAFQGRGVVLGRSALAHEDLQAGSLVAPFDLRVPYDCAYWFVCPEGEQEQPKIEAIRAWLKQESASFPTLELRSGRLKTPRVLPYV